MDHNPPVSSLQGAFYAMLARNYVRAILGAACPLLMMAQESDSPRMQEDRAILKRIENAGSKDNLALLQAGLDSIQDRREDPESYARMVSGAFNTLYEQGTDDPGQAHRLEQKYVLSALERPDKLPTEIELYLVMRLRAHPSGDALNLDKDEIRTKVNLLFHAWRRMEHDTNPGFKPDDMPYENVMPPGPGYSGMDPALISDSRLRDQYLAAIERNRIKTVEYNLQDTVRSLKEAFVRRAEGFLVSAIRLGGVAEGEVLSSLSLVQDEASRKQVVSRIQSLLK